MKCAADYRQIARNALKGNWPMAALTGFVATLMGGSLISYGSGGQSGSSSDNLIQELQTTELWFMLKPAITALVVVLLVWVVAIILVAGAAKLGYAVFNLNIVDHKKADLTDLFSQFNRFGTGFVMNFLVGIFTFLWSLLFLVPGIIKSYSYAMTPYILAENPHMTANEAITESRRVMNGNKWRLFCMHFSFIGWHLLCISPVLIAGTIYIITGNYIGVLFFILSAVISFAGALFIHPYQEAAQAAFYRDISTPIYPDPYTENQVIFES